MVDRIADIWGPRTPHPRGTVWPARVDTHLEWAPSTHAMQIFRYAERAAPAGRASLKGAPYIPLDEEPSEEFPLLYTTGRTVYQFHTRTKTGRARALQQAAPDAWVELSPVDAGPLGVREGDVVRVESARGAIEVRARVGQVRPGCVFAPFHYGSWDLEGVGPDGQSRQGNELTMTVWDPVSKQPYFKTAAWLTQAAQGVQDRELLEVARSADAETSRQLAWLNTRMKAAAPQALVMAP